LLWGQILVGAGGAGNASQMSIEPGVNELVIVEGFLTGAAGATIINGYLSTTPLTGATGNLVARDARRIVLPGGTAASGTFIRQQNNTPLGGTATQCFHMTTPNGDTRRIPLDLVLVAPWSLRLVNGTNNSPLEITVWVRVRQATPRELSIGSL